MEVQAKSARESALAKVEYHLVPHRSDDSQDAEESWSWKIQRFEEQEDGSLLLIDSSFA